MTMENEALIRYRDYPAQCRTLERISWRYRTPSIHKSSLCTNIPAYTKSVGAN